ncbi:MAG: hypothetical protein PF448_05340 [Bacteroidales bacterium]|jgi:hypothetical protein|nr:hypothetical protein [Bacteroidales bacterium]
MKRFVAHIVLGIGLLCLTQFALANPQLNDDFLVIQSIELGELENDTIRFGHYNLILQGQDTVSRKKRSKLIAIAADLLTGPLGGHRIYLGTEPYVPVVYALTLGGGMGFLPVVDLFVIIFTRNLGKYCDNSQVIMWL